MNLREMQVSFINDARQLDDYQLMSKTELANGYCDAEEAEIRAKAQGDKINERKYSNLRSAYYSALILRYWYKIFDWSQNSASLNLELTDFVDWLSHSLYVAFYYRTWRYEYKAVVKHGKFIEWKLDKDGNKIPNPYYYVNDINAPDKIINRCCGSMRGRVYQYYNKDKRKAEVQTYSLDQMVETSGDGALVYGNVYSEDKLDDNISSLIIELLNRNEGLEALIIDGIANFDSYKEKKQVKYETEIDAESGEETKVKYDQVTTQFDARKLVKHLNLINEDFMKYFCQTYSVEESKGLALYEKLKNTNNTKLYKCIKKTLMEIRETPELLSFIQ